MELDEKTLEKIINKVNDAKSFLDFNLGDTDIIEKIKSRTKGSVSISDTTETAYLEKEGDEFNIVINKDIYENNKDSMKFFIAHELGRLLVYCSYDILKGKTEGVIVRDMRSDSELTEVGCSRFAMEFILPEEDFIKSFHEHVTSEGDFDISSMSRDINTPIASIVSRAYQLDLIEGEN